MISFPHLVMAITWGRLQNIPIVSLSLRQDPYGLPGIGNGFDDDGHDGHDDDEYGHDDDYHYYCQYDDDDDDGCMVNCFLGVGDFISYL